jgi:cytochrome c
MKMLLAGVIFAGLWLVAQPPPGPERRPYSGEALYRQACYGCHALEPGADSPAAPTLHDILGRRIAARPGFNYSPALRRLAAREVRWTRELMDAYLADPETVAPGTEMSFIGMSDVQRRALIDWLARRDR